MDAENITAKYQATRVADDQRQYATSTPPTPVALFRLIVQITQIVRFAIRRVNLPRKICSLAHEQIGRIQTNTKLMAISWMVADYQLSSARTPFPWVARPFHFSGSAVFQSVT